MISATLPDSLRVLVLAPQGRDAALAAHLLTEAGLTSRVCDDLACLVRDLQEGAGGALITEETLRGADLSPLYRWLADQPPWSDMPILLLTRRGGGPERNPDAFRLSHTLGNVTFIERPFHPTTLISHLKVSLRGRRRQYEARERIEEIRAGQEALRQVNANLEDRVNERTAKLAETEAALRQAQKLEAIGQLTGGIAHDFNNLLMVISGGLTVLDKQEDPKRRARILEGMRQASERGAKLTRQLLAFSRTQPLNAETVDLVNHVEGMRALLEHALRADIDVDVHMDADLWPVRVDPTELELVILNLCVNARDAMPKGGEIRIRARNIVDVESGGEFVCLSVSDTGVGMTPEVQAKVFEPFFTTKDIGKGSGLGLAQVYGFALQSGGSATVESEPGDGTSVILHLPRAARAADPVAAAASEPAAQHNAQGEEILLVEDDDNVATLVGEMLSQLGYSFRRAATAQAALDAMDADGRIDAVFSDIMMPGGVDGIDLAREIQVRRPDLPVLLTSGRAAAFTQDTDLTVLEKPYSIRDLAAALRTLLSKRAGAA